MVKVSVIVPVFNVEGYLARCLDSLARQTLREIEVIFVDDGSTDGSGARLDEFARTDDGNCYKVRMFDDAATYTEQGVTALTVDSSAVFIDNSDPGKTVRANYSRIVGAMLASSNAYFDQYNTTITIENGRVVEINRAYVP